MINKFTITFLFTFLSLGTVSSQIGIGTTTPATSAVLDLNATNKALLLTRVASVQAITNPVNGMIVYDLASKCIRAYENGSWSTCFNGMPTTTLVPTSNGGTLKFMTHNLGADPTADPLTPSWRLNGAYFQWGKKPVDTNGDNYKTKPNNGPEGFAAATTVNLIEYSFDPIFGLTTQNPLPLPIDQWSTTTAAGGAWNVNEGSPVKTTNDPCPSGFRVPTRNEWQSIYSTSPVNTQNNWSSVGTFEQSSTNYFSGVLIANSLYLPHAGIIQSGYLAYRGSLGKYWSSTESLTMGESYDIQFSGNNVEIVHSEYRTYGESVRCVAE